MATRMQQRRGTAAQWTSANPILAAGEIGFESDTNKFKIGDGVNHWADLTYFADAAAISDIIDGAPDLLNTLNELAAAIGDDPDFITTIGQEISTINNTLTNTVSMLAFEDLVTATENHASKTEDVHGISNTADLVYQSGLDTQLGDINTTISGVVDSIDGHTSAQTSVHGISNTQNLVYTDDSRLSDTRTPTDGTVTTAKIVNDAVKTAKIEDGAVTSAKIANGTIVNEDIAINAAISQGKIADLTSDLAAKADLASPTFTGTVAGITKSMVGLGNVDNTTDANKPISSATQTALDLKAPLADPTFTGTVSGITKSMVGLGNVDNTTDANKPVSTATQTALDLKANLAGPTFTGTVSGITKSMVGLGNVDNTTDANKPVSTATQTALDLKAPKANPTFTGTTTAEDVQITGNLTVSGTTTTVSANNLVVDDSLIYLADQNTSSDALDIGIYGAYYPGSGAGHKHTGLFRDASDSGKWKLISAGAEPTSNVIDLTSVNYDTLVLGTLEATSATIGNVSNTELQYLDGVTSAIQTQMNAKAPLASPTFTGTVTLPSDTVDTAQVKDSAITSAKIADGTIVNADINASAAIATSKISGLDSALSSKAPLADPTFTGTVHTAALTATGAITASSSGVVFTDGTQTKEGVPSRTAIVQKTADYTLSALTERDSLIEISSSSAVTLTVPSNSTVAYPVGTSIDILQTNTGQITVAGVAGVTINATPGLKLRTQWSGATLFKRATDTWVLYGDLSA